MGMRPTSVGRRQKGDKKGTSSVHSQEHTVSRATTRKRQSVLAAGGVMLGVKPPGKVPVRLHKHK